jgi:hypothetical protein
VEKLVNEEPGGRTGFKKTYGVAYQKHGAIESIVQHGIRKHVTPKSCYGTKVNALSELSDIGLVIMGAVPSQFARDTRNGPEPRTIMDAMMYVAQCMGLEEREKTGKSQQFLEDMRELEKDGGCYFRKKNVNFEVKDVVAFLTSADGVAAQVPTLGVIVVD